MLRRPVARPPFKRSVTIGELIEQLESVAKVIDSEEFKNSKKRKQKRFSNKEIIAQVNSLAHREKLPETTAALGVFIENNEEILHWIDFDLLVQKWRNVAPNDLDDDRIGVFWALLFLSSQGKIEIKQEGSLYSKLYLKRILMPGTVAQMPLIQTNVPADSPAAA